MPIHSPDSARRPVQRWVLVSVTAALILLLLTPGAAAVYLALPGARSIEFGRYSLYKPRDYGRVCWRNDIVTRRVGPVYFVVDPD
jgi:hypothetical protein